MSIFRRGDHDSRHGAHVARHDAILPPLSVDEARWLVAKASAAMRSGGAEVTYDGSGSLSGMDGRRYGLGNLAVMLSNAPRRRWPGTVARHVETLLEAQKRPTPRTLADIQDIVVARITPTGPITSRDIPRPPRYAPSLGPDLHVLAALDYPTHVTTLGADDALDAFGGWEAVGPYAEANLRRLPPPVHSVLHGDEDRTDTGVHLFTSDDFHGASRVLLLDELLATYAGTEAPAHGALFVVPNRHVLAAHPVEGLGVIAAARLLVQIVQIEHEDAPGPVSPHVYYRAADGAVERISRIEDDGRFVMDASGSFGSALAALGLLES